MRFARRGSLAIGVSLACTACHREATRLERDAMAAAMDGGTAAPLPPAPSPNGSKLGITAMQVWIHQSPSASSPRLGYARLGAVLVRSDKPAGKDECPGAWYGVYPRGYVCIGEEATLDLAAPLLRAASLRPDLTKPLPYRYGFVRAVAPLYLKIPDRDEQLASEFALERHLAWWAHHGANENKVTRGANDVALDPAGAAIDGAPLPAGTKSSVAMSQGELFGGTGDGDAPPLWLQDGRSIPNVSGFMVPAHAVFADRVRRHTGLAFVGSFATGDESFGRRFAITTDLRLVPVTKVKPDSASPFHGVAIRSMDELPFAWVRTQEAHVYRFDGDEPVETNAKLARRTIHKLNGKTRNVDDVTYREISDGRWLKGTEAGAALVPAEWPKAAEEGEKWIDISIENQVLVAWQGKTALYATLVSTGQDGMGDPLTTKSTIRGTFRIRDKHLTITMDSNGKSAEGGGAATTPEPQDRDPREGKTIRRGEGTFELRDVPWVQYFEKGFALHAAYWHDVFGMARSHGCVNLSPIDAHWLFAWTEPPMPLGWHGVLAGVDAPPGTTVVVHR
jgi:lipoprotein-anchoring transpeptidase ErfK/SrfK